ncbi:hypothetical protein H1P_6480002 [Hyella patelloides LEGE 07179]|uniref:Uncharacterized protein n=1 Tax=Hyella patelloides LEGE 07179 TaxID=945734 RepID=A0A563W2Q4_9CYAN|nr:hypothetical protein H1P_6480002 [Hyella patelloides LEGE 07179]
MKSADCEIKLQSYVYERKLVPIDLLYEYEILSFQRLVLIF